MRRRSRAPASHVAAAGIAVAVAGSLTPACRDATAITLDLETDLHCDGTHVVEVGIAAGHLDGIETRPFVATTRWCQPTGGHVGSFVLVPSGDDDEEVAIRVVAGVGRSAASCGAPDYAGCIVERRVLRYEPHVTQDISIDLIGSCTDVPCEAGLTCRAGACVQAPGATGDAGGSSTGAKDAAPPPPTCPKVAGLAACCGTTACVGAGCAQPGACAQCTMKCNATQPLCCATPAAKGDPAPKVECRDVDQGCN